MKRSIIATPPGATIKEQLQDRGMSQKEFATRMDMSEKHISRLINGEVQLTPDVAVRLEMVLGIPAAFWSNLETVYREKLIKIKMENEMEEDKILASKFPYKEMVQYGWIEPARRPEEKVINLRKFFEVVNLSLVIREDAIPIVCRRLAETEKSDFALVAWAQKAKLEARNINTKNINIEGLIKTLPAIRSMTNENPDIFCPQLCEILSACGVALVFLPHIGGSFLHGASFYDGNKIVIGLTVRGKDADRFWFSLFHELGHVILGHINGLGSTSHEQEAEADLFAREALIPADQYDPFISGSNFSEDSIVQFAKRSGINAGIVVGRLQKEGRIKYSWHNNLKVKYMLAP